MPKRRNQRGASSASRVPAPGRSLAASKFRVPALLSVLVLLAVVLWATGSVVAVPHTLARRALQSRDFETAAQWVSTARKISPSHPSNALLAARIARRQGQLDEMAEELRIALRDGADAETVRREQMLALAQLGQLEEIEDELIRWLAEAGAEASEISDAYANGLAANARFEDAIRVLEAWRQDYPEDPRPEFRLGRFYEYREQYDEAEAQYRLALSKDARYFPASYSLGRVLLHQRRAEEALTAFRDCLEMPYPLAAKVEMAACHRALGQFEEARTLLEEVVHADRSLLEASYRSLSEQPEGFAAAAELGSIETDAGNFQEAEHWLRLALEENPRDLVARYALAVALRGQGRQAEAEKEFEQVRAARTALEEATPLRDRIRRDAEDSEARLALGNLLLTYESERKGLYWIRSILAHDPYYLPAHQRLAEYYTARAAESRQYSQLADYHRDAARQLAAKTGEAEPGE